MAKYIANITLILLVLLSSMGITVNRHFCQQQLKGIAVLFTPKSCHDSAASHCQFSETTATDKSCCSKKGKQTTKNCCSNESQVVKSLTTLINPQINTNITVDYQLIATIYLVWNQWYNSNTTAFSFHTSKDISPPLQQNIRVCLQSFLC